MASQRPLFISIPHSGEKLPPEVSWLQGLPEPLLMCDVDRYVDRLYAPAVEELELPWIVAQWHRYVVDLNRLPEDIDQDAVEGAPHPSGRFPTGLHWSVTTKGDRLIAQPMPMSLHRELVDKYFWPFHHQVEAMYKSFREQGYTDIYHLDAHSMPSQGTAAHRDPGQLRADIVISDVDGTSCRSEFKDLVLEAFRHTGLKVAYNWPYKGGRLTQTYGRPGLGQHCIQVEINRALYMNEVSKQWLGPQAETLQVQLRRALKEILSVWL